MSSALPDTTVQDLCEACVSAVEKAVGIAPDFTPDTLALLDHYVSLIPDRAAQEVIELVAPAVGAYFGEVIRRALGDGTWHTPDWDLTKWRIRFERCFLHFNPVGVAMEVIHQDEVEGWNAHFQVHPNDRDAVRAGLERLGSVSPEDYYRFTVRFEVAQQVAEVLRERQAAAGEAAPCFGPEVYDAADAADANAAAAKDPNLN